MGNNRAFGAPLDGVVGVKIAAGFWATPFLEVFAVTEDRVVKGGFVSVFEIKALGIERLVADQEGLLGRQLLGELRLIRGQTFPDDDFIVTDRGGDDFAVEEITSVRPTGGRRIGRAGGASESTETEEAEERFHGENADS